MRTRPCRGRPSATPPEPLASSFDVPHAGRRSGETLFVLPGPVMARRVRWQVTNRAKPGISCAGGAEITFFQADTIELEPRNATAQGRSEVAVVLRADLHQGMN